MKRQGARLAAMLLGAALAVTACGDDDSSGPTPSAAAGAGGASEPPGAAGNASGAQPDAGFGGADSATSTAGAQSSSGEAGTTSAGGAFEGSLGGAGGESLGLGAGGAPIISAGGQSGSGGQNAAGGAGGTDGAADTPPTVMTVAQLQQGATPVGRVELDSVWVTAVGGSKLGFWVADHLTAAAYEGVFIHVAGALPVLAVGAKVTLSGTVQELGSSPVTLTEVTALGGDVTVEGGPVGAPTPLSGVSAATWGSLNDGGPYEGVLVSLTNLKVNASLGSGKLQLVSNDASVVILDDTLSSTASWTVGTCFSRVTGIGHVDVVADTRVLLHRSAGDVTTGNGCN